MKVAVCLSGHSRNYKHNYPNFDLDADVFISSCEQSGLPNQNTPEYVAYHFMDNLVTDYVDKTNIINLYKPKLYEFLDDKIYPKEMQRYVGVRTTRNCKMEHIGMMFYRIYRANTLKKKYEYLNNFKYDFVIRSRFDIKINQFNINKDYLYLVCSKNRMIDLFFAGRSHIMDAICDCYNWFIHQEPDYLATFENGEDILRYYIESLNLNVPFINNFDITFNKDYPIQVNHILNGLVRQVAADETIIHEGYWQQ